MMPEAGGSAHARLKRRSTSASTPSVERIGSLARPSLLSPAQAFENNMTNLLQTIRLDYISCVLTVLGAILLGKKLWQGWVVAAVNSAVVCVIGVRTAQFGFIPANLFCIALYTVNLRTWRFPSSRGVRKNHEDIQS
jgi:hypothetical protein